MPTVIVARHGRSTANTSGVLAGRTPGVHLDSVGEEQATAAGRRLAAVKVSAIVTSPLERCRETAARIRAEIADAPRIRTDKEFSEVDYGEWSGRALKDLAKEPLWKTVQRHPSAAHFPGGESLAGMSARVVRALRRWDTAIAQEHGPDAVWVLVSHGDPIKALLADALGSHLDAFQRIMVDPASLSVVRYTEHRPFVVTLNSTAGDLQHLNAPAAKTGASAHAAADAAVGGGAGPTA